MPNVVIVRNTYPDIAALSKAVFQGGYGVTPEIEAAQIQMLFVNEEKGYRRMTYSSIASIRTGGILRVGLKIEI